MIVDLDARSREVFRLIVDGYVKDGEPVGSRSIARKLDDNLSPATIRNVMSDLVDAGLIYAPHASAGRLPTQAGLRFFVDGLLEIGALDEHNRSEIEARCAAANSSVEHMLGEASQALSGLSRCAGMVVSPKHDRPFRHVEFVPLSPGRALVIVVTDDGMVENRVIDTPLGMSPSTLVEAGNFLTARLGGRQLDEARRVLELEIDALRTELDDLTAKVVEAGLATWAGGGEEDGDPVLILKGHSRLLGEINSLAELERVRQLFDSLERQKSFKTLLELTHAADGVQIYIGSETETFGLSGCSVVVSPYKSGQGGVVGAIGVIGPTRMNFAQIVPMVDYTARVVSRLLGGDALELPNE